MSELNEPSSPVCYAGEFGGGGKSMKAIVTVGLKPGVLDVQGKAVAGALKELGFGGLVKEPTKLYEDNQAAISMCTRATKRSKHIDIVYMLFHNVVAG